MIRTKNDIQHGQVIQADICLIGGGPAAISIALQLSKLPINVVMITGGGWSETSANQDLYRGVVSPTEPHEPLEENRRRQFGGASAVWGGRCIPFEPIDFKPRAWVPDSGWPFSYETLLPYYRQAAQLCQIGDFSFSAHDTFPRAKREIINGLDTEAIVSYPLERWSPPINFAKAYKTELERSESVQVLLDAHVLALQMQDSSERISHVDVTMGEVSFTVKAGSFVLAAGGIENPRLLLASANHYFPTGIGNQHDNVGRYYMAHLDGTYAELNPKNREELLVDFERDAGVYCRRRWWIPEAIQTSRKLLNTVFFLYHPNTTNGHRDVLFSSRYVVKSLLSIVSQKSVGKALRKWQELSPSVREHAGIIARDGLTQIPDLIQLGLKRMAKRRLPFILPARNTTFWGLYFQAEQRPNRASRVSLSSSVRDAFGMPRAEVSISFTEDDIESVVDAHNLFVANFREKNLGEVRYSEQGLREYLTKQIKTFNSAAHHIGTTRMSDDPQTGVVDGNSKVYGLDNLYVAGSSVFPTGGHANPTLTLVAQALRLADHLRKPFVPNKKFAGAPEYGNGVIQITD